MAWRSFKSLSPLQLSMPLADQTTIEIPLPLPFAICPHHIHERFKFPIGRPTGKTWKTSTPPPCGCATPYARLTPPPFPPSPSSFLFGGPLHALQLSNSL